MNDAVFDAWNRDSESYRRFTDAVSALLGSDTDADLDSDADIDSSPGADSDSEADSDAASKLSRACEAWESFFVESHGDVFEQVEVANPRERIFVDALYYDFVVDRLLAFAEETLGFELINREPHHDTDALAVDFGALHETVADAGAVADAGGSLSLGISERLTREDLLDADVGFLRDLYESIVSREVRLALGEYYTPRGVAELAVEELRVEDWGRETVLDPGCGSGVFLAACIDRKREALAGTCSDGEAAAGAHSGEVVEEDPAANDEEGSAANEIVRNVTDSVYGIDLNPVAVKSAKLSYVLSLAPELASEDVDELHVPVYLGDALGLTRDEGLPVGGSKPGSGSGSDFAVDHLVGNPPWITWGNLTEEVKDAWRERYTDRLDLFPHDGAASRLGHGNDDASVPFVWVCVHRYLREGGDASFVLKRSIAKGPAGKLLRTQRVDGRPVGVRFVHDFTDLEPFGDEVGAGAAIYTLSADEEPDFPIGVSSWTRDSATPSFASAEEMRRTLAREETGFVPVDDEEPTSAWVRRDAERRALGECDHRIRHGLKDDAKSVFSVDEGTLEEIESEFVYPYITSRHVVKYGLFGHDRHLVPMAKAGEDNEAELREQYPRTYEYLESNRERLEDRASSWLEQGPFYNVFGLGEYTWADYKVVWCRLGFKPHFAVVSTVEDSVLGQKQVVPGDHYMFVSTDSEYEAHFLTALLNSAPYQKCLKDTASEGKASLSKSVVSKLELPEYRGSEAERRLAELSMEAHGIVPEHTDVSKREYNRTTIEELAVVQGEIDEIVEETLAGGSVSFER